jgi:hypothetical protein
MLLWWRSITRVEIPCGFLHGCEAKPINKKNFCGVAFSGPADGTMEEPSPQGGEDNIIPKALVDRMLVDHYRKVMKNPHPGGLPGNKDSL